MINTAVLLRWYARARRHPVLLASMGVALGAAPPAHAQTNQPVAGVGVTLSAVDGTTRYHTTTNARGAYVLRAVAPGRYRVTFVHPTAVLAPPPEQRAPNPSAPVAVPVVPLDTTVSVAVGQPGVHESSQRRQVAPAVLRSSVELPVVVQAYSRRGSMHPGRPWSASVVGRVSWTAVERVPSGRGRT